MGTAVLAGGIAGDAREAVPPANGAAATVDPRSSQVASEPATHTELPASASLLMYRSPRPARTGGRVRVATDHAQPDPSPGATS